MTIPDEHGETLLVDVRGKPLVGERGNPDGRLRGLALRILFESTAAIAIGTAVMFYLGHVYYQNFFGSFGSPLSFPPMGTSDYLTKAFDLATSPFVQALVMIWIATFVSQLSFDASAIHASLIGAARLNRTLATQDKELYGLPLSRRALNQRNRDLTGKLKKPDHDKYVEFMKEHPERDPLRRPRLSFWWRQVFPFHVSWHVLRFGLNVNAFLILSLALMTYTSHELNVLDIGAMITIGVALYIALYMSILGFSVYFVIRSRMESALFDRFYFIFLAFLIVVFTAEFFAGGLGRHDARQFMKGEGAGPYLTSFDVRGDRPDLEGKTFRVVIQRNGDYYVVPSDQGDIELATLVVIPKSEILSQTTEAVDPH